jgi:hypothetical protein
VGDGSLDKCRLFEGTTKHAHTVGDVLHGFWREAIMASED